MDEERNTQAPANMPETATQIAVATAPRARIVPKSAAAWSSYRARWRAFRMRIPNRRWLGRPIVRIGIVVILGIGIFQGVWQILQWRSLAQKDTHLASTGFAQLQKAKGLLLSLEQDPLNSATITLAQNEFTAAQATFTTLAADVNTFPGALTAVPHYGAELQAARDLTPPVMTFIHIGLTACDALAIIALRLHDPLNANAAGLTSADLAKLDTDTGQIATLLQTATQEIQALSPADLRADARIGPALADLNKLLPGMQDAIGTVRTLLPVAPLLLGINAPTSYLVEVLDSTELRPGGGFIGNYGIATVQGGRLADLFITDVDLLDRPFEFAGNTIPYPKQYQWFDLANSWSLRDSNLDADFPTAARYAEQIYHTEGGKVALQGVFAVTPWLIQQAMRVTGPIYVSEYHETITADNLVARIHYHQLKASEGVDYIPSPDGHSSERKRFTSYLFEHFLARVKQILPTSMAKFIRVFGNGVHAKDVQLYFNDPVAQRALTSNQLGSTIAAPATGDSVFIVDANIGAVKANNYITYTAQDRVTLDPAGNATHQLTLTWNWPDTPDSAANIYAAGDDVYRDYVRIYVPPGSQLQAQSGWQTEGTGAAFGRAYFAGLFRLPFGHSGTMTLTWQAPKVAVKNAQGWRYTLFVQKQAGIAWQMQTHISFAACGALQSWPKPFAISGQQAQGTQTITQDTSMSFSYHC